MFKEAISSSNCGPFNFNTERSHYYKKEIFLLNGYVIDPDTGKTIAGATVKIIEGTHPRFNPLTKRDVIVKGENVVREPYWSGVRAVRNSDVSTDRYSNVNADAGGSTIYIMQTKHEIL